MLMQLRWHGLKAIAAMGGAIVVVLCPLPTAAQERRVDEFEFEGFAYWADLCDVLERQGDYAEALDACETAIELEPKKRETLEMWVRRGNALVGLERYEEAIASYNQVLDQRPDYSSVWTSQCEVLLGLERTEDAISACDRAIAANGNWGNSTPARAWRYRAGAYRQQADRLLAGLVRGEELERLFPARPRDADAETRQSTRLFDALQEANRSYERAIVLEPDDSLAWAQQCGILVQLGRVQSPTSPGYAPQPTPAQRYEQAIATCREAIAIDGNWGGENPAVAWGNLAAALHAQGELETGFVNQARSFEQAIATYEKALEIDPQRPEYWTRQGQLLQQLGRDEKALLSFDRAVELAPNASLALAHRCELFNAIGKNEAALEACEAALQGDNRWDGEAVARTWNQQAAALVGLGDYEGALASVERAIALYDIADAAPVSRPSQSPIERCRAAGLNLAEIARRDLDLFWDGYRQSLNNKAAILWHLERYREAEGWAILALSPESVKAEGRSSLEVSCNASSAWFNYGKILRDLNREGEAIAAYDLALATYAIYRSPQVYSSACQWLVNGDTTKSDSGTNSTAGSGAFSATSHRYCANIWVNQSAIFFSQNRYTEARSTAENAILLYPESFPAWYNLAIALAAEGQYEEALEVYDRAETKIPGENKELADRILAGRVRAIVDWGEALQQQAQTETDDNQAQELYQAALNLFERSLQLDPDYIPAQQAQYDILNAILQLEPQPTLVSPQPGAKAIDYKAEVER